MTDTHDPTGADPGVAEPAGMLRHDLRGLLSPIMLVADRLTSHDDPAVHRAGEVIMRAIKRITERLDAERGDGPDRREGPSPG